MNGLILAGGHSRRMKQPKSLLNYHGRPQYQHVAALISDFCERVFISCRMEQKDLFVGYETIIDSELYGDIGPMNGVLSAFDRESNEPWLVLGCDYPLLEKTDLEQLLLARDPGCVATVFFNPATLFTEPLLGIYEVSSGPLLHAWLRQNNESLRRFLEFQEVRRVAPRHHECLKSIDTPEEFQRVLHAAD